MQKMNSYSKYQKEIIKKIGKELGANTPFKYEKTSSNHLKVFIEGLDKPRYTACTPSDSKAGDNFMADLRCALKAACVKRQPKMVMSKRTNIVRVKAQYIEHFMAACIKAVRTNIQQYTEKEKSWVVKENSIKNLKIQRKNLAARIFEQTQKTYRNQQYITGSDSNMIKGEILKHLCYMLPNTADYIDVLKPKKALNGLSKAVSVATGSIALANVEAANESVKNLKQTTNIISDLVIADTGTSLGKQSMKEEGVKKEGVRKEDAMEKKVEILNSSSNKNPAETLAAMNKSQAIQNLRQLSRNESEAMLEYIKIAMAENHQQDLQEVLNMMTSKGITLNMLSNYSENAA